MPVVHGGDPVRSEANNRPCLFYVNQRVSQCKVMWWSKAIEMWKRVPNLHFVKRDWPELIWMLNCRLPVTEKKRASRKWLANKQRFAPLDGQKRRKRRQKEPQAKGENDETVKYVPTNNKEWAFEQNWLIQNAANALEEWERKVR